MSFSEENSISINEIKIEPHVKTENIEKLFFQKNHSSETCFQIDRMKLEKMEVRTKQKKFRSNAEKQKAYRERKKRKLEALSEQNKSEEASIKQDCQNSMTNIEKLSCKVSFDDKNNILIHDIKTELCVNEESTKKTIFQENCATENYFPIDRIKQEITDDVNNTENSFIQGNNFSFVEIKEEPSEENIFNYNLADPFHLLTNEETCHESKKNYRRPMTNAEKQKAYRERKKWRLKTFSEQNNHEIIKRNQEITINEDFRENNIQSDKINDEISANDENSLSLDLTSEFISKNFLTFYKENLLAQKNNFNENISFVNVRTDIIQVESKESKKGKNSLRYRSNAEKQKAYRERKKKKFQSLSKEDKYKNLSNEEKEEKERIRKLKQREKQKRCRERKKLLAANLILCK